MAEVIIATPPLTSAQAVLEYLHPVPLERIEIGPLYPPQQQEPDGKLGDPSDITHFARTSAKAVAIDSTAYEELLSSKQRLKRQKGMSAP
jgi:hypothetical protein